MKKLILMAVAVVMVAFTGCKGSSESNELKECRDSLTIALGELHALRFQQMNDYYKQNGDSTGIDKAEYLKGFKVVLSADTTIKGKSFIAGMQAAMQEMSTIEMMEKDLGITRNAYFNAIKEALSADSLDVDQQSINNVITPLFQKVRELTAENDPEAQKAKAATQAVLADVVKKGGKKVTEDIAGATLVEGTGAQVAEGQTVNVKLTVTDSKGEVLLSFGDSARPMPVAQFAQYHPDMLKAILSMKEGGHSKFYVNMGVNGRTPFEYFIFDVEICPAEQPEDDVE